MCGGCDTCGYVLGNALFVTQKLASCCAMAAVTACLVVTLILMLGIGVGVGYHYCIVQEKTYKIASKIEYFFKTSITMGSAISTVLYVSEKLSIGFMCMGVITCVISTIIIVLMLGIGLGYNYCFVDYKSRARYRAVPGRYVQNYDHRLDRPYIKNLRQNVRRPNYMRVTDENSPTPSNEDIQRMIRVTKVVPTSAEISTKALTTTVETKTQSTFETSTVTYSTSTLGLSTSALKYIYSTSMSRYSKSKLRYWKAGDRVPKDVKDSDTGITTSNANAEKATKQQGSSTILNVNSLDLIALLSQLRAENRNYSVQILVS